MHSKSGNIEIMINDETDEVIKKLFKSLFNRYQNNLEKSMKSIYFFFNYIQLLYYKCHKINPNRGGSSDSPDWIENKKETINHINKKR